MCYFLSSCSHRSPDWKQLKGRRTYFGSQFEGTVHDSGESMLADEGECWSHWGHSQDEELWRPLLRSLLFLVQDPSPWNGPAHAEGEPPISINLMQKSLHRKTQRLVFIVTPKSSRQSRLTTTICKHFLQNMVLVTLKGRATSYKAPETSLVRALTALDTHCLLNFL